MKYAIVVYSYTKQNLQLEWLPKYKRYPEILGREEGQERITLTVTDTANIRTWKGFQSVEMGQGS